MVIVFFQVLRATKLQSHWAKPGAFSLITGDYGQQLVGTVISADQSQLR
jgi:hypothetical protein